MSLRAASSQAVSAPLRSPRNHESRWTSWIETGALGAWRSPRVAHHRGGSGRRLGLPRHRIGLERHAYAVGADDVVFVALPGHEPGNKQFPHARGVARAHGMAARLPPLEVAGN